MIRKALIGVLAGVLSCGLCSSQDSPSASGNAPRQQPTPAPPEPSSQTTGHAPIAPGSVIPAKLTNTVDARKARTGDEVDATVTQDLQAISGEVVVPKDTQVVGHVTEVQTRNKEQKESQVGIAFDHAVMKDGSVASLPMSIQAMIARSNQNSASSDAGSGSEGMPTRSPFGGLPSGNTTGRQGDMGGGTQPPAATGTVSGPADSGGNDTQARRVITADTEGVVGFSNYRLSTSGDATQGSVVSSDKNNVKLDSGTLLLLRVNH